MAISINYKYLFTKQTWKDLFKNLYRSIYIWYWKRQFDKEIDLEVKYYLKPIDNILLETHQEKYQEAIILLKKEVNKLVKVRNKDNYDSVLKQIDNMAELTRVEDEKMKALRIIMENMLYYKEQDIKSEKDKEKMINTRINHYMELQNSKEKRELLRQIRKAHKENNKELLDKLQEKWDNYK